MNRIWLTLLGTLLAAIVAAPAAAAPADDIRVFTDGELISFDGARPVVVEGTTLVPLRTVAEALGASVAWDERTYSVTISREGTETLVVRIGRNEATRGDRRIAFEGAAPSLLGSRVYVPLRFVAESFEREVRWDEARRTIEITAADVRMTPASIPETSETLREKLAAVQNYKYYLDAGDETIAERMKELDLIIVEPIVMQPEYIRAAQESGTVVYGYINALEADKWNEDLYRRFEEQDFYKDVHGNRMYFRKWDSYLMNITSPHYQEILLEEIEKRVVDNGLDGVFLDTVGNIESYLSVDERPAYNEAMKTFIIEIRKRFDGISVAQNWGFDTLLGHTAPYVDFIMWEDFSYPVVGEDEWALERMERLKEVRDAYGTQVMTVGFSNDAQSAALAAKHGFKYFFNPEGSYYNEW